MILSMYNYNWPADMLDIDNRIQLQVIADLVTFIEEILNGKLHCFVQWSLQMKKIFTNAPYVFS